MDFEGPTSYLFSTMSLMYEKEEGLAPVPTEIKVCKVTL